MHNLHTSAPEQKLSFGPEPAVSIKLAEGEVHVWDISLAVSSQRLAELARSLSDAEHQRAARLHHAADQARFTAARSILRDILSRYTGTAPGELVLSIQEQGKPELIQPPNRSLLQFNVSHTSEVMLLAIAQERAVGIDIERLRVMPDVLDLSARLFSAREHTALRKLEGWQRVEAFFNAWTRKEAVLKALGRGLTTALSEVEVTLLPSEPAALLKLDGSPVEAAKWSLLALDVPPGFAAALAVAGGCQQLVRHQ